MEVLPIFSQQVVKPHINQHTGVFAVGRKLLFSGLHLRRSIGEGIHKPMKANAALHLGRVGLGGTAAHAVGYEVSEGERRLGKCQIKMGEVIQRAAKLTAGVGQPSACVSLRIFAHCDSIFGRA